MDLGLKGKRALVTGASKGIGLAVRAFARGGRLPPRYCRRGVAALEQARDALRKAAPDIDVRIHAVDLSKVEDQKRLAAGCAGLDILVNNAGSNPAGDLGATSDEIWRRAWDLKVFGYINLCRSICDAMRQRGEGVIANIIGYAGERLFSRYIIGRPEMPPDGIQRVVGSQSPDFGVRVFGINPGYTSTDRAESVLRKIAETKFGSAERWRDVERDLDLPFGRMGTPRRSQTS
jgi:NAD(P)-dependent dehydrogenase (short-subunit alcohol dehydrogenase family)